jgi:ABC-type transporter Mla subunit MlaD
MPRQHDEVWAGGFVALALALLFVMVFSIGNCRQVLRGRQEMTVLFSHVTGLQSNSPVNYAGVEIGRVREIRILTVTPELLAALPAIGADEVDRLPVSLEEADRLKAIAKPQELNEKARELIVKRTIIGLQLEIARGSREIVFREDDLVRLEATLMGQSTVEISPGSGKELPAGRNLLGDGSNLLTQMSSSMRDVRKLLERLSNIVGDEERTAIHATLANIKKVSDDASQTITAVRDMVKENREGLRTSVADLRKAMEEARKAVEEIRPAAVAMVDSGRKMMDKGQETTKLSAEILNDAKPHLLSLIENADKAAKATAGTIEELDHLLVEAGDTVEESRPMVRRAMLDLRESSRNLRDMTDRLKFEPWLLMKAPAKGSQDVALLDQSARNLASASDNLTVAVEQLKNIAEGNAPDVDAKRIADLMEQMRAVIKKLEERRTELEKKLKPLQRKDGGRVMETVREKADQDK